jgi:hypothetical protein
MSIGGAEISGRLTKQTEQVSSSIWNTRFQSFLDLPFLLLDEIAGNAFYNFLALIYSPGYFIGLIEESERGVDEE